MNKKLTSNPTTIKDYKMFNEQDILNDLSANDWDNNRTDTNAKYNVFIWDLEHYVNRHAPMKKVTVNRK